MGFPEKEATVTTPGVKVKIDEDDEVELDSEKETKFGRLAARANYLSSDRPDIQFAVKELSRSMAKTNGEFMGGIGKTRKVPQEKTKIDH